MWKKFVKDYLTFSKKDRAAVLVLLLLIFIVVLLPYIWPIRKPPPPDLQEIARIQRQVAALNGKTYHSAATTDNKTGAYIRPGSTPAMAAVREKKTVFYFDPNTLDQAGWRRLGIREKTAATIINYTSKGGKFRTPEDLGKIYGLYKDDYARLLPYVTIAASSTFGKRTGSYDSAYRSSRPLTFASKISSPAAAININTADSNALIALPGIGSKLAARIINFRDRLGGFYSVQQVGETYGVPDSTFQKIKLVMLCDATAVRLININAADANTLKQHPYIRWNLANAIVQYRQQHGNYKNVNDLQLIALVTPELFEKLKPYISIE